MSETLYIAWQDDESRSWHTVAKLARQPKGGYELTFTQGVERLNEIPEHLFGMQTKHVYRFDHLLPLFKNRLLPRNRSDFRKIVEWLNLSGEEDEFTLLSRFGLIPGTDSILLYPEPDMHASSYRLEFFVHGIRHMHPEAVKYAEAASQWQRLLPLLDVQNPADPNAVALRTADQVLIGYVPAFYARDIRSIVADQELASDAQIRVVRNNIDAPVQIRLLCRIEARVKPGFRPLDTASHRPRWMEPERAKALTISPQDGATVR